MMWNDGPEFINELTDPWAPHPVVNRIVCSGGGGGQPNAPPTAPNYSPYITAMSNVGNQLNSWGNSLYNWATGSGVNLGNIAGVVAGNAANNANWASTNAQQELGNWEKTYGPIYGEQAAQTQQDIANLPATQEQWAGQYGAGTAQAFDASKAAATRKLQGYGLSEPTIGSAAIDAASTNQRAAAVTASANTGRLAAKQYVMGTEVPATEQAGAIFPQVTGQMANLGLGYGNQQINAPESAVSTTAGAYQPSLSYSSTAYPYMAQWGNTMMNGYNQTLQGYNTFTNAQMQANAQPSGWGALAGSVIGAGAKLGAAYMTGGASMIAEKGGMIPPTTAFVAAGSVVPSTVSPSEGRTTDDVAVPIHDGSEKVGNGAINVGEFIIPKDVVSWRGEKFYQKDIAQARNERGKHTVAEPEHVPASQSPAQAFQPQARAA